MYPCDDDSPRHIGAAIDPLMNPQCRRYQAFHAGTPEPDSFTHRACVETKGAAGSKSTVVVRAGEERPISA